MDRSIRHGHTLASFDVAKFIAAILVVIHTHPFHGNADYWFTCFCRIAVPFFFASSSFFFWRNPDRDIKKYIKRLSGIYAVWFVLELPYVLRRFFLSSEVSRPEQVYDFISHLFLGNTFYVSWYLMASIIAMGIIFFLSKRLNNIQLFLVASCFYIVCLLSSSYFYLTTAFPHPWIQYVVSKGINLENSFFAALIYMVIGKVLAENVAIVSNTDLKTVCLCFAVVALIGISEIGFMADYVRFSDAYVSLPLITIILLVFLLKLDVKIPVEISRTLRETSILVYLLHAVVQGKLPLIGLGYHGKKAFVIVVLFSIFVSLLIILLSKKIRVFKLLY